MRTDNWYLSLIEALAVRCLAIWRWSTTSCGAGGRTWLQLVKVHPQELRSVFPHVDFTNVPRHNGNIRLRVTACLRLCHRRA